MHVAKRIATWFALGCSLACATAALALDPALDVSQYAHTAWKIRDGFVSDPILAFAQTSDGYLWLGTNGGLQRFDGVRAVPWNPPAGTALPDTRIRTLLAARDGTLWIGTHQGLASWDGRKLVVHPEFDGRLVDALVEDRDGLIWVATKPGARLCAIHDGRTECKDEEGAFGRWIASLLIDKGGALWVASDKGVWRWKPGPPAQYTLPAESGTLQALSQAPSGAILVAASRAIWQIRDGALQPFLAPREAQAVIPGRRVLTDLHGGVWTATAGRGLIHVREGRIDAFSRADGLSSDDVLRLFEDREGNVWVATLDGLDRFRVLPVPTYSEQQGISGAVAAVLADVDGSVWLSSSQGLHRWHAGRVTVYRGQRESGPRGPKVIAARGPIADETVIEGLPRDAFASLFKDRRGRLWLGSQANFGFVENGRFTSVAGVPPGYIDAIVQATDGRLWFTHRDAGLLRLGEDLELKQFPWSGFGATDPAMRLAVDPVHGGIWLAFYAGGVTHFVDGEVRDSYTAREGLGSGTVHDIRVGPDGTVWVATDHGLSRIRAGHVATLDRRGGLPCDIVQSSIEDDDASAWIYTACGLVRIERAALGAWLDAVEKGSSPQAIRAMVLDASDGVRNVAQLGTFTPYMTKARDGNIWFVGYGGVSVVDPRHLPFNTLPPPVHVEEIVADRKTYETSTSPALPALVRDLRIDYTALSFVAPEKVQFRYKLAGRDRDWQDAGNRRQAFYTDLGPGNYRFRVIAANNSGVWNQQGATLDFTIPPAWWQTLWFRIASVASVALVLWTLYVLRVRQIRANEAALRASETRFRTFVDHATDAFLLFDEQFKVVDVNRQACEKLGWSREELIGMRPSDFDAALDERSIALLAERAGAGETITVETRHRRKDGTEFPVEIRSGTFTQGGRLFYLSLARDITERKLAEETVRGKDQALQMARAELARVSRVTTLGELTTSIAHEVNQPLGAMVANAAACVRWLAAQPPELGKARQTLESITADGRRAGEIIGRIRALTKRQPPSRARLDVNRKILDVLALAEEELRRREVAVETRLGSDLPPVSGDRVQLQQVLLNLIVNAIDAMDAVHDRPRTLTIVSQRDGSDGVAIEVRDSGTGLDPEAAERVFEAFYTTKPEGIGIGLSISRSIVEAHGGQMSASANAPHGAVFRFTLPLAEEKSS